jgi:hypothetical protein
LALDAEASNIRFEASENTIVAEECPMEWDFFSTAKDGDSFFETCVASESCEFGTRPVFGLHFNVAMKLPDFPRLDWLF